MVAHSKSLIYSSTCRSFAVHIQWNPVNTVTNGPKKFGHINGVAVLTRVFFYKKMYGGFCQAAKKWWP